MHEQLKVNLGQNLVVELLNGKKISGVLVDSNIEFVTVETAEGKGTIPYTAIAIIWDNPNRSLTEENMDYIANKLRSEENSRINCTSIPGFNCVNQYVCIPPDNCVYTFACPGIYTPGAPQGGCTFNFFPGCTFNFFPGCTFFFQQPCGFQFYQPCGFRFYFVPCGFRFTQPCFVPFQQPCALPFGCTAPGGFACPGQAFIGIAPTDKKNNK